MSRSESPSKGALSDEDLIKKLKSLLIKEKKINKENNKIIIDLKEENVKKSIENNLLIGQIQRLSENIGNLDENENKKNDQLNNLSIIIDELKKENENFNINEKKYIFDLNQINGEIKIFLKNIKNNLKLIVKEEDTLLLNKLNSLENNDLFNVENVIINLISNLKTSLNSIKNEKDSFENKLSTVTLENNDFQSIIFTKDETIESLKNSYNDLELEVNERNIMVNNKIEELNNLSVSLNVLQKENEKLKLDNEKELIELNELRYELNNFIFTFGNALAFFIEENENLFIDKLILRENNCLFNFGNNILKFINEIKKILKSNKDVNNVLKDGLIKLTIKCDDFESIIETKDEKIEYLLNSHKELSLDENDRKSKMQFSDNIDILEDKKHQRIDETNNFSTFIDNAEKERNSLIVAIENIDREQFYDQNPIQEINNFLNQIDINLKSLIEENNDVFADKSYLSDNMSPATIVNNIINRISDIKCILKSNKDINIVLQDGLTRITLKCNDLDAMIIKKDEKIESLRHVNNELDQKEEQIKRLEELIEGNRNISRALETERDQLQNDLVDLRQRHEEKEGYLIEEFREAQLSLENYRIFTDKQSAEKANEIERLRKCIDDFQGNITQESLISDYSIYKDIDTLFEKLRVQFGIDDLTNNYESLVLAINDKYTFINITLNERIETIRNNEYYYRQEIELISERLNHIEIILNDTTTAKLELERQSSENELNKLSKMEILKDLNDKLLEKEKKICEIQKETEIIKDVFNVIEDLLDVHDSSLLIAKIKKILLMNIQFIDEIELYKCQNDEQRSCHEMIIQEKDSNIKELTEKLAVAGKHVNHNDLMNLEMAEIDKTLVNLNNQLLTMSVKIVDLESIIKVKESTIETMTEQLESEKKHNIILDERNNKMKQMLVKTKRELTDYKNHASSLQEKQSLHVNKIERFNLQLEETKVLLSESISEKDKLQERHSSFSKKTESIIRSKEITICSLRTQLEETIQNYKSLQQEYDFYKVKVQTAFNTKARSPSIFSDFMALPSNDKSDHDDSNLKSFKTQVTDLEMVIDDLKIDQREKDEKIFSLNNDLELIKWDNEKLSEKFKCLMKENNDLILKMQQINEQLQNDYKVRELSHSDMLQRFSVEKDKLNNIYQLQIESMRSDYEIEIQNYRQKIDDFEIEKVKFQEEIWDCREQLKTVDNKLGQVKNFENEPNSFMMNKIIHKQFRSPLGQERQQGEGMEMNNQTENASFPNNNNKLVSPKLFSKTTVYNNAFVSLDQLLNPINVEEQNIHEELISTLRSESISYRRKIEHVTELLNDSEATVARLTEQAMLLKTEIRRLENNQERDSILQDKASKEYLKNVIIKFLHFETKSDERSQLIPVIVTLLSLDAIEKELLTKFARIGSYNKNDGEGWSSYFSWTGMS